MPAHPWSVAAYAGWCERRHSYGDILGRIKAIGRAHVLRSHRSPHRHPTVMRTLRAIRARAATSGPRSDLFRDADFLHDRQQAPASEAPPAADERESGTRSRMRLRRTPRLVSRRP